MEKKVGLICTCRRKEDYVAGRCQVVPINCRNMGSRFTSFTYPPPTFKNL